MDYTVNEVLQFAVDNDIKFVKLAFCNLMGVQKNISIVAEELPRAFESGISFDASAVTGFGSAEQSDLLLIPDPTTLSILPWRPQQGRVARLFCDVRRTDGSPFEVDGRQIVRRAEERAARMGFQCQIGSECEFYLFEMDEKGQPTHTPHDDAGYCDVAPADRAENVRRDICLTLEQMGIEPESSHHEQGPGQNEVDFRYAPPLIAADRLTAFKSVVKTIAVRNGLYASFMPKPIRDRSGSGLHINLSLCKRGENLMGQIKEGGSDPASCFLAGLLAHIPEITLFLNPITNSYSRFGRHEAPRHIAWGYQNRSVLVRLPGTGGKYSRIEVRSPDGACNPYLAYALLIHAGLTGIEKEMALEAPEKRNLFVRQDSYPAPLPDTLGEALSLAKGSELLRKVLPGQVLSAYFAKKEEEWEMYAQADHRPTWEDKRYFNKI